MTKRSTSANFVTAFATGWPENQPEMRFIFVRGLSAHTHGNASGIGLADFTTARLVKAMNYQATVINCAHGVRSSRADRVPSSAAAAARRLT